VSGAGASSTGVGATGATGALGAALLFAGFLGRAARLGFAERLGALLGEAPPLRLRDAGEEGEDVASSGTVAAPPLAAVATFGAAPPLCARPGAGAATAAPSAAERRRSALNDRTTP
jgi:hypothetical protein